jgi:methylglutaconyl-CoA hydratase
MQATDTVTEQIIGTICEITFSSHAANALSSSTLNQLAERIEQAGLNRTIRAIHLKSDGATFCAGASFDELSALTDPVAATAFFLGFAKVMLSMYAAPKPVVVSVQGKAVGGGVGLIAAADWVIAHEKAAVRLSELSLGIGAFTISPAIIKRIGIGAFQQLSFSTDWYDCAWCHQHGLFHTVSIGDQFEKDVAKKLNHFSSLDPHAFSEGKKLITNHEPLTKELFTLRANEVSSLLLAPYAQAQIKKIKEKH